MNNKLEIVAGGVALAALTGAAFAAFQYKNNHRSYHRKFDVSTNTELKGKVEDVMYSGKENGEGQGIEILLKSNDELISVHLGPAWYIEKQDERVKRGDKLKVRGSKILHNNNEVVIAESVIKGGKILRLRDEYGSPVWSAWAEISKS